MFHRRRLLAPVAAACLITAVAACSSSSTASSSSSSTASSSSSSAPSSSSASAAGTATKNVTVGLLVDETGAAANGDPSEWGAKAGVKMAAAAGDNITYVAADTTSTPAGALAAAQKLVNVNHVTAVILISSFDYAVAPFFASKHIPVVGEALSPIWTTDANTFAIYGAVHYNLVASTLGGFFKSQGVTTLGVLAYGVPSSAEYGKSVAESATRAGIKVGYINTDFQLGSTNVQPVALAMKNAHVDGVYVAVAPNAGFALFNDLKQLGATPKSAIVPGDPGDIIQAGPSATQAAQGSTFAAVFEPVQMNTAATQQFVTYLKAAGSNGIPSEEDYFQYVSFALLVQGLQGAGSSVTSSSLLSALSAIHNFDAAGLTGSHLLDVNNRTDIVSGVDNCNWMEKIVGSAIQLVPGADPICGTVFPGVTVGS